MQRSLARHRSAVVWRLQGYPGPPLAVRRAAAHLREMVITACTSLLSSPSFSSNLAAEFSGESQLSINFNLALQTCHPNAPPHMLDALTPKSWVQQLEACSNFSSSVCTLQWRDHIRSSTARSRWTWFMPSALPALKAFQCALIAEYPLAAPQVFASSPNKAARISSVRKKTQDIVMIGLLMRKIIGKSGTLTPQACRMLATAVPLGWNVLLGVGVWRGMKHKISFTLRLLSHFDRDALVLYTDMNDILVQQPPEYVARIFAAQSHDFVWGYYRQCSPLALWPYNIGLGSHVCDTFFPGKSAPGEVGRHHFVNAGGWLGTVAAAERTLRESESSIARAQRLGGAPCVAQEQYFTAAQYIRNASAYGIDEHRELFAVAASYGRHGSMDVRGSKNGSHAPECTSRALFCEKRSGNCPALLHFPGHTKAHDLPRVTTAVHRTGHSRCLRQGSLRVVNVHTGALKHGDVEKLQNHRTCANSTLIDDMVDAQFWASLAASVRVAGLA